ncbi:MAG: hypothetical protein RLY95_1138 [Pseudomonadota bacterium]|jgi:nuclear transport factor 2 (NTF2) superfamily protein
MNSINNNNISSNKLKIITSSVKQDGGGGRYITKDYDDILLFKELNKLSQYISKSNHKIYSLSNQAAIEIKSIPSLKLIFRKIIDDLSIASIDSILPISEDIIVNPWIDILIRANEKLNLGYFGSGAAAETAYHDEMLTLRVAALNRFIEWIRRLSKTKTFKTIDRNLKRKEDKNQRGTHAYLQALWARYSDLNFVRVDLEYKKDNPCWFELGAGNDISVAMAIQHREVFLNRLERHPLLSKKVGYLFKLEYGFRRGLHIHALLIFNGQTVKDDIGYGQAACKLWNEVTENRGDGWNCNLHKADYARTGTLGIGRIRHYESELRHNLENDVLDYYTKLDGLRKLKSGNKTFKTFVKGLTPIPKADQRGRLRKVLLEPDNA